MTTPTKPLPEKIATLANAGVTFTLLRWKEKRPLYENWPNLRYGADVASKHVAKGGNLGAHLGRQPDGSFLDGFDADYGPGMSKLLTIAPELRQSLAVWRNGGSSKIIFRTDAPLGRQQTPDIDGEHTKLELIVSGQAAIFGAHPAGDAYHCNWKPPISLTPERVKEIWLQWTGQPWDTSAAGHRHEDAGPADAEAVQRSQALVEKVLELAGVQRPVWKPYDGAGRKVVLEKCPFNPTDDPHAEDRSAAVVIGADGRIGATCHHARCQARIQAHEGGGWALLKSLAGFRPEIERQNNAQLVEALREWARQEDFADQVPITLQSERGYRTQETDKAAADAILDLVVTHGRLENIPISLRKLRAGIGCGSINTAKAALARLSGWFVVADTPPPDGDDITLARRWSIAPALRDWAAEAVANNELAYIARILSFKEGSTTGKGQRAIYASSPLTTEKARDAFSASQTPLTRTELNARIAARDDERAALKAAGVPDEELPPRINPRRYRRRLAATLPSAGRRVLRVVDALAIHGGMLSRRQLCGLLHLSESALSRALARGAELGLLDVDDRHLVHLADDWKHQVDRKEGQMPTAGRRLERAIDDVDAGLRWLEKNMHRVDLTDEQRRQMERRQAKLTARKAKLVKERFGIDIDAATAGTAAGGQPGDTRQTTAQTLASKKPRRRLTEQERFVLDRFGSDYAEEAAGRWGRFNEAMNAEHGAGWWVPLGTEGILVEFAAWEAAGQGL